MGAQKYKREKQGARKHKRGKLGARGVQMREGKSAKFKAQKWALKRKREGAPPVRESAKPKKARSPKKREFSSINTLHNDKK